MEHESSGSDLQDELRQLKVKIAELEISKNQVQAEGAKLNSSEERFRLLVESVKDYAIFMLDPNGRVESWNSGAQNIKGYLAKEVIGRHFSIFYPPEDNAWNKPKWELEQAVVAGRFEDEGWRLRKDGTRFWANVIITALRDERGALRGFAKVTRDMTERKRAEAAVHQANAELEKRVNDRTFKLSFLAEASKLLASSLNYETTLQRVAQLIVPQLADWCSVYILENSHKPKQVALAHADPDKIKWAYELQEKYQDKYPYDPAAPYGLPAVLRTGQPELYPAVTDEMLVQSSQDDEQLQLMRELNIKSLVIMPLIARERILGAIQLVSTNLERNYTEEDLPFIQDVAQRASLAVDNARLYEDAQQAIALRNEFLSVAAHELKTPITSLRGFTQLLIRKLNLNNPLNPDQLRQGLEHINTQSSRLSSLVGRLLDISQLEAGKLILNRESADLSLMLQGIVDAARMRSDNHQFVLEAPEHLETMLDPLRFEQVLNNLLDNAIKYSPEGGTIRVELTYLPDSRLARIKIKDQGIGILPENLEKIFEPFYQGQQRGYAGLGLGLYISRQIIDLHGGIIEAESVKDSGATFVISLPVMAPATIG